MPYSGISAKQVNIRQYQHPKDDELRSGPWIQVMSCLRGLTSQDDRYGHRKLEALRTHLHRGRIVGSMARSRVCMHVVDYWDTGWEVAGSHGIWSIEGQQIRDGPWSHDQE